MQATARPQLVAADTPRAELRRLNHRPNGANLLSRVDPAMRDIVKEAIDKGALLRAGTGKHPMKVICPDGESFTMSTSTSDWRARKNFTAYLRRHGLDVGPRPQKPKPRPEPGQQRAAAWLAMQAEDREFTTEDFAAEMGLSGGTPRSGYVRAYLRGWLEKGRIHEVRRVRRAGQRGIGTPVYSRRPPLRVMPDVDQLVGELITPPPSEGVQERVLMNVLADYDSVHLPEPNGHAPATTTTEPLAGLRSQMWRNISEALLLFAQAAEIRARLDEG